MHLHGMRGTRLLSDIFTSQRLPAASRRSQWVLKRNDEILWIVGGRSAGLFPITPATHRYIHIWNE